MNLNELIQQAHSQGTEDRTNGWGKADNADLGHLIAQIPVEMVENEDGVPVPSQATRATEDAVRNAYAAGYRGMR